MVSSDAGRVPVCFLVVSVLALLTAGCVALPDEGVSQAHLEERLDETNAPDELAATVEVRETIDGETSTHTETVWLRADGSSRIETGDMVIVNDGTERYFHDLENDSVRSFEIDPDAKSLLEGLYGQPEKYVEAYDVTSIEETTIDGRDVYRVALDPPGNETIERSISVRVGDTEYVLALETAEGEPYERSADRVELWLDQETMFPVKHAIAGDGIELETTYWNLSIDAGLEEDLFEPPETSTDENESDGDENASEFSFPSIEQYDTIDEADATVPFAVAEPAAEALPDAVELDGVTEYEFPDENRTQVSLSYRNGDQSPVTVTTSDGPRLFATTGESVTVGDVSGAIERTDEGTELQWSCDGVYYSVFADASYERGTAVSVGESLETNC
ncbi:LolA family protein [Natronorubrum halophilum]|uniref:LolA family protein n=1 Tax=Natronorubrum halophilum TaxID=1702106 RepID=UPI000EF67562|nr:outer membrane lipoprotein carrier protein LolA [Natronorubrum halophilum]